MRSGVMGREEEHGAASVGRRTSARRAGSVACSTSDDGGEWGEAGLHVARDDEPVAPELRDVDVLSFEEELASMERRASNRTIRARIVFCTELSAQN